MTVTFHSHPFGPFLDVAAQTSAGADALRHRENQDNYLLIDGTGQALFLHEQAEQHQQVPGWPEGHVRVAVLDGMGGHGRGREAAEAVVAGLLDMPACATLAELSSQLDDLHYRLQVHFAIDSGDDKRPGTTLTMLELRPGKAALLYHVGDSRLYEVTHGRIMPLTIDHVPATAYAMAGLLDEEEWWRQVHGEHRSQISQAFILGNAFADPANLSDPLYALSPLNLPPWLYHLPDRRAMELDPEAVYVLATDGFWSCADPVSWICRWPTLLDGTLTAAESCDRLFGDIITAPPPGLYPDNLTAVVLRSIHGQQTALPSKSMQ